MDTPSPSKSKRAPTHRNPKSLDPKHNPPSPRTHHRNSTRRVSDEYSKSPGAFYTTHVPSTWRYSRPLAQFQSTKWKQRKAQWAVACNYWITWRAIRKHRWDSMRQIWSWIYTQTHHTYPNWAHTVGHVDIFSWAGCPETEIQLNWIEHSTRAWQ